MNDNYTIKVLPVINIYRHPRSPLIHVTVLRQWPNSITSDDPVTIVYQYSDTHALCSI